MQQEEAIRQVSMALQEDPAVEAIFLKGSMARGEQDAYSDVDMYCMVNGNEMEDFLGRRIAYMETYKSLIYWSETNFVGPQIVGVFEDGLHFDLYTVTPESLKQTDEILILHDPEGRLVEYRAETFSLSDEDVSKILSGFTFSLLEFESAYHRKDLLWAHRLGSHLASDLMMILRYVEEPTKARLGIKGLHRVISATQLESLTDALNGLCPNELPKGVQKLVEIAADLLDSLSGHLDGGWNQPFFDFMAKRILALPKD